MALRYRKSKKILPGVRLNINKNSVGLTLGGKGLKYTINSKGRKTATVGIPGTGLSYSKTSTATKSAENTEAAQNNARTATPICELCNEKTTVATLTAVLCGLGACVACASSGFGGMVLFAFFVAMFYVSMLSRDTVKTARKIVKLHPEVGEGPLDPAYAEDAMIILYRGTAWRTLFFVLSALAFLVFVCVAADINSTGGTGSGSYIAKGVIVLFFGAKSLYERLITAQAKKKLKDAMAKQ